MYKIREMRKVKTPSKLKRHRRALLGAVMVALCITTVAAVIYSNMLEGNVELVSTYPMLLEWENDGPYETAAFCDVTYSDNLIMTNQHATAPFSGYLMFSIAVPNGATIDDVYLGYASDQITWIDQGGNVFKAEKSVTIIAASSKTEMISIRLNLGAPVGTYTLILWLDTASL